MKKINWKAIIPYIIIPALCIGVIMAYMGMNAKEKSFLDKYVGKSGGNFVVNKDNKDNLPNEIDAISGATITTRAMTKGVNAAYITAMEIMSGGDTNE